MLALVYRTHTDHEILNALTQATQQRGSIHIAILHLKSARYKTLKAMKEKAVSSIPAYRMDEEDKQRFQEQYERIRNQEINAAIDRMNEFDRRHTMLNVIEDLKATPNVFQKINHAVIIF